MPDRSQRRTWRVAPAPEIWGYGRLQRCRKGDRSSHISFRHVNRDSNSGLAFRGRLNLPRRIQAIGLSNDTKGLVLGNADSGHNQMSGTRYVVDGRASDTGKGVMMTCLCDLGNFIRGFRMRARFGELSRAPLCLLRFQLCGDAAECDWLARPPDAWDAGLPPNVGDRNASQQALKDAIAVRDLLFTALPDLSTVAFRVYRRSAGDEPELIIAGSVSREERAPLTIRSLAMRAKLLGFRFWMDDGILETLQADG